MWLHVLGAAVVLVPTLLALQAWRFLRLTATPPAARLRGFARYTAAQLGPLPVGTRALVEGRVVPLSPGAALPGLRVRRKRRPRGTGTLEVWRERTFTPPLALETAQGRVRLEGGYALRGPRGEAASREVKEGQPACALVTLEQGGASPRVRAEWLHLAPLERLLAEQPGDARPLRQAVAVLGGLALLGALGWAWLAWSGVLSRPGW